MTKVTIKQITSLETRPLRKELLRPNWSLEDLFYNGDDDTNTYHVGAFIDEKLVSIASVYNIAKPDSKDEFSWQLRGMAVLQNMQGQGIGKLTLDNCIEYIKAKNGKLLWCNARIKAVEFYKSFGFIITSKEFEIDDIGIHYIMEKILI